ADSGLVVAGVECPPAILQINFEPRAEVHRRNIRNSYVTQISSGVPGGDVKATAKCDCEMLKIAADASAIRVDIQSRLRGTRKGIAECDVPLHPIAYRLYSRPSRRRVSE